MRSIAALLALALALIGVVFHSHLRRTNDEERARELSVHLSGGTDLALSTSSRWLRHPIESEPAAAFADAPCSLDVDPASILLHREERE